MDSGSAESAIDKLVESIEGLNTALTKVIKNDALVVQSKKASDAADKIQSKWQKAGGVIKSFGIGAKAIAGFGLIKKIFNGPFKDASDMLEQQNLFEVSLGKVTGEYENLAESSGKYYEDAINFQDTLHSKFLTNKAEMQSYQGMFYNMFKSQMGDLDVSKYISTDELMGKAGYNRANDVSLSEFLSEQVTKMGIDMASLFNVSESEMMRKLQSGLAGQVQTLRGNGIGIDITQASLQTTLDSLGVEKSVSKLSYAEKEIARYISILQQAGVAQGDFARTMNQPANQMRIFQSQIAELRQNFGSLFIGIANKVFPIVNGIIMAISAIIKALGRLFNFSFSGIEGVGQSVNDTFANTKDTVDGIGSGIGGATKAAKEFRKQLMGFDEINNIEPPTSTAGSGGRRRSAVAHQMKLTVNYLKD